MPVADSLRCRVLGQSLRLPLSLQLMMVDTFVQAANWLHGSVSYRDNTRPAASLGLVASVDVRIIICGVN